MRTTRAGRSAPAHGDRTMRPSLAVLMALGLAAGVLRCTRAAGVPAARSTGGAADEPFIAASGAAMDQMMKAMAIRPSGDVDRDFVAMMVPHHESAIAMARAELRYGKNEQLRRMAQEIVVTQQQEIASMRLALR
jgi:uncharacterized protein (DUF305 family)